MKRLENFLNERDIEGNSKEDNELKEQRIDIKFSNCNFGIINYRNNANKVLLKDINIEINKGDLVAVLGETGSGKTCLANAILNYLEYIPSKETCINVINGTVSYAAQNHWIMNESIRNNILFYNEMYEIVFFLPIVLVLTLSIIIKVSAFICAYTCPGFIVCLSRVCSCKRKSYKLDFSKNQFDHLGVLVKSE